MGFSAPGLLPLAGLAAIPVIIHILSRLRVRRVAFPSLMLLRSVRRERFSWIKAREIILLILRTLALLFLLLSLARPFLAQSVGVLGSADDVVIVLDDSYSMSYSGRWDRARTATQGLLRSLGSGRKATVLLASGRVLLDRATDHAQLVHELDTLSPSLSAAMLDPVLDRALALGDTYDARVIAVTDAQARAFHAEWRVPEGRDLDILDVGDDEPFDNTGIVSVRLEDPFAGTGLDVRIKVEVANHGEATASRTARLSLDSRVEDRTITFPAGSRRTLVFETTVSAPGAWPARVDLLSDSLGPDNSAWLILHLSGETRVLVVESGQATGRYVADALSADPGSRFKVTQIDAREFARRDPRRYDVVVVTDAFALGPEAWTRLDFLIRSGGAALLMVPPFRADTARLGEHVRALGAVRTEGFVSVRSADTTHPVLSRIGLVPLSAIRFRQYTRLDPLRGTVLATLSSGDPFIIEDQSRRVMVWSTGPVPSQSDLVHRAVFVPLLHRTIDYLARHPLEAAHTVGDTVAIRLSGNPSVTAPSGRALETGRAGRDGSSVEIRNVVEPGIYTVSTDAGEELTFAVNVAPEEGDLRRLPAADLADRGITVLGGDEAGTADLSVPFLVIAALAFAAELLLLLL